eukprot:CAMPEP_0172325378 /NCGR_PEP_ID=MMETSP1058-20130122/53864_1 /TAXON_ID=83371 /ORGANISM="Detonula confervacea, Strain CCMP 353" /LENGTH=387 /DNA_ID=CAMNT_0013041907 /DNA_START=26 /DNA_END=1189 /DNA_ORIENTATION=-
MSFLAIDHSQVRSDDGLYTGEEVCAMLGENDDMAGIEQVGVEMELDEEALISTNVSLVITMEEDSLTEDEPQPQHDSTKEDEPQHVDEPAALSSVDDDLPINCSVGRPTKTIITIGRAVNKSISRRSVQGKLRFLRSQLFTKATSKLKSVVNHPITPLSSPKALQALKMASDNSTCDMTHASNNSSSIASHGELDHNETLGHTPSSITASTCDFCPDINHHAVFESYLVTNPWEAAKRGDYATLSYIANHDDDHIWTQEDESGHVPLYYACTSYSQSNGLSFGKYGLESIKLLVRVWPLGVELPTALLNKCNEGNNNDLAIHKEVVEVLSRSTKSEGRILQRPPLLASIDANLSDICDENNRIEGVSDVVPVSFLEDLGDDGYVEDY